MKHVAESFGPRDNGASAPAERPWLRVIGTVLLPAVPASMAMTRHYGAEGLVATAVVAFLAIVVTILPTLLIPRGNAANGPNYVLGVTVARMGLFLAAAVSLMFAADDVLRMPSALLLSGFYLLALAVETIAGVWAAPARQERDGAGAEETR